MGAPSPELSNLWLARVFNGQDAEAAAALITRKLRWFNSTTCMAVAGSFGGRAACAPPWPRISTSSRTCSW